MSRHTRLRSQPSWSPRVPERHVLRPRAARHLVPDVEWWYEEEEDATAPLPVVRIDPQRGGAVTAEVAPALAGPHPPWRARAVTVRAAGATALLLASIAAVLVLLQGPPPADPLPHSPVPDALPTPDAPVEPAPGR